MVLSCAPRDGYLCYQCFCWIRKVWSNELGAGLDSSWSARVREDVNLNFSKAAEFVLDSFFPIVYKLCRGICTFQAYID